ncbi:MAG: GTPase ObgE [Gemmatimonadetes bacterium]|nr:GTPase ObgE [Gemmatimonadota bacterium]MYC72891.1 GTPase ObgE [Gemmatimonadota bacterium]MYI61974.1 GTPase ObgE [Gemmatimonadota bacterium]
MFIDEMTITVESGSGGNGCCSFRREKFVPRGGPDGGDGGDGGDVIFRVDPQLNTLHDFRYQRHIRAGRGAHGEGKRRTGQRGAHAIICVPPGTILRDAKGALIRDMVEDGQELVLLVGGRGGRGNARFATPRFQAPRRADSGREGEQMVVRLELKLLADVGLVGFPNAGKSTLLSRISAARPKIADYPFTTLEPNLGIVQWAEGESFVLADLPGLIEGAHAGKGLGTRFLRHIERTRILLFAIDCTSPDPRGELEALRRELDAFDEGMRHKPAGIALTKADLLGPDADFEDPFADLRAPRFLISAVSGRGVPEMLRSVGQAVKKLRTDEVGKDGP